MDLPLIFLVIFSPLCVYSISLMIYYHIFTLCNSYLYDYRKIIKSTKGCSETQLSFPSFIWWFMSEL